jgi:hypothetical protein
MINDTDDQLLLTPAEALHFAKLRNGPQLSSWSDAEIINAMRMSTEERQKFFMSKAIIEVSEKVIQEYEEPIKAVMDHPIDPNEDLAK